MTGRDLKYGEGEKGGSRNHAGVGLTANGRRKSGA